MRHIVHGLGQHAEAVTYGVGRIVKELPGCRVLCVYLRGDGQESWSALPRKGERFRVETEVIEPKSDARGLRASLDIFDDAGGVAALRRKSERQIEFFDRRLAGTLGDRVTNITPASLDQRGCQFALRVTAGDGKRVYEKLEEARVLCDWREPDVIRVAPVPLYTSFDDIDRFVDLLDGIVR